MKAFLRTLLLPLIASTLVACGGSSSSSVGDDASVSKTLEALTITNLSSAGYPWRIETNPPAPVLPPTAPGILKRWQVPIPVKSNGEQRAIAAMDDIERQLATTIFDRTSIASLSDNQITRGLIVSVGTAFVPPGTNPANACGGVGNAPNSGGWPQPPATPAGIMSLKLYIMIDGPACRAGLDTVIHEFGHALGMGPHYEGFGAGDPPQAISALFWRVLRTIFANAPGTPAGSIMVP